MSGIYGVLLLVILASCSTNRATGPYFLDMQKPENQKSVVYFYYPPSDAQGSKPQYRIYVDGQFVDELHVGGYISHLLRPGRHRLSLSESDDDAITIVSRDRALYVTIDYRFVQGVLRYPRRHAFLTLVDEPSALTMIRECRLMMK